MRKSVFAVALVMGSWSSGAGAAQLVVFDAIWDHTADIRDSHYYPRLNRVPASWVSPVNYATGTAHVHLEVLTKPTATPTRFQVCFEGTPTYACTAQSDPYTATGTLRWATAFSSMWSPQATTMNWSNGVERVAVILKDTENGKPSADNVGDAEAAKYMPTRVRMVVSLVTQGSTYVPPGPYDAGAPVVDAGGNDARADAGADASSAEPDGAAGTRDSGTAPNPDSSAEAGDPEEGGVTRPPRRRSDEDDGGGCNFGARSPSAGALFGVLAALIAAGVRRGRRSRQRRSAATMARSTGV
jgi:hypothetical protein